ncbi:MAG: penicillin-binding protein 1B [Gammaproteobacteria bacterium]
MASRSSRSNARGQPKAGKSAKTGTSKSAASQSRKKGRRVGVSGGGKNGAPGVFARARRAVYAVVWRVGVAAVVVAASYFVWLDLAVRPAFDGKRWALPARLYARPLEVYAGASLTPDRFEAELRLLGYNQPGGGVGALQRPGSYERRGGQFLVASRGFRFWDGDEPERALTIAFDRGRVASIEANGRPAPIVRLEPLLIGRISPTHNEDRVLVRLKDVPPLLPKVLMAVEDRSFYEHPGISLRGLARAVVANVRAGGTVQCGSTLTQQLAKNFYLTHERTWWRKLNEAMLALLLEIHYDKPDILEAYLNEVFLGQQGKRAIHGFGLASRFYFARPVGELDLDEIAMLVALVKGASFYNPRKHPQRVLERRNLVLNMLVSEGVVSAEQAEAAKREPLGVTPRPGSAAGKYPAFLDLVRRQLQRDYRDEDLRAEGVRVFTTVDPLAQQVADAALREGLARLGERSGVDATRLDGASVTFNPQNGEVLALAGGRDAGAGGFNRALDARRPIGSLVKPVVYLSALQDVQNYSLATLIDDAPVALDLPGGQKWRPENYDNELHGQVPLYMALARSYNLATVQLGLRVGLAKVAENLHRLGVEQPIPPYPSILLGAVELTPLEVAQMYQTIGSGGFKAPLRAILEVTDAEGRPLNRYGLDVEQAIDPDTAFLINAGLERVMVEGTGRRAYAKLPGGLTVAGKTGTTDDLKDSWFAGYAADRGVVVWLGHDDNTRAGLSGSSGALTVWTDMMVAMQPTSRQSLAPAGVEWHWTDPLNGYATDPNCSQAVRLPYAPGSPIAYAPCGTSQPVARTVAGTPGIVRTVEPESSGVRGFFDRLFRDDDPPPVTSDEATAPAQAAGKTNYFPDHGGDQ